MRQKIVTIVGARPQFIKAAVLSRLIRSKKWNHQFREILVHTGQHYDPGMSEIFFQEMEIPKADYKLGIGSGTHGRMTGEMLIKIEEILLKEKPDIVLVYGDTNSTLAGALAASKLNIPIAHVEAGLRSFWKRMPEEQNRILTDHISDFLFYPTNTAAQNLKNEGICKGVYNVGDIMLDAHQYYNSRLKSEKENRFDKIIQHNKIRLKTNEDFFLATIHRAENTDDQQKLSNIVSALNRCGKKAILPIHPRLKKMLELFDLSFHSNIQIINPVGYLDMLTLQLNCKFIVSDSGGIQKEAYFAKKPCITLREQTEWTETKENGWNTMVGADTDLILQTIHSVRTPSTQKSAFGNGNCAERILEELARNSILR